MAKPKQIFIHAGAHRTGSSSFQMCLHHNREALNAAGYDVAYPGRDGIPSGKLALRLPSLRHGRDHTDKFRTRVERQLREHSPDNDRPLILSEENIIGRMLHFYAGQFYPAAEARLDALKAGLRNGAIARVVVVVRAYHELFVSAYRKRAEDHLVDPFAQVKPNLLNMDRGWPELIEAIVQILNPKECIVIPYEHRGSSESVLQSLVPDFANTSFAEPQRSINRSATDAALHSLQTHYQRGDALEPQTRDQIIADQAHDTEQRGFAAFEPLEVEAWQMVYESDLETLCEMPGVTVKR